MPTSDLSQVIFNAINHHATTGTRSAATAAATVTGLIGLILLVKGARLAPVLAALALAGLGAALGFFVSDLAATPLWPTVAAAGAVGLLLGLVLFKLWLAILVAACLIFGSLCLYSGQVLREPLNEYLSAGLDRERELVTLPAASENAGQPVSWRAEAASLWSYLGQNVPNFQVSLLAIVVSTGLAGLVLGLLLPNVARAFWGASLGTLLTMASACGLSGVYWPASAGWLSRWGLVVAGVLWVVALLYNLADVHGLRLRKPASQPGKTGL